MHIFSGAGLIGKKDRYKASIKERNKDRKKDKNNERKKEKRNKKQKKERQKDQKKERNKDTPRGEKEASGFKSLRRLHKVWQRAV